MTRIFTIAILLISSCLGAQSPWPSVSWNAADNLTSVMDADGITDLSGLHWNPVTNRLYCVQGDGRLRVLQMDSGSMGFTQIANKALSDGPEGITQVNFSANEFYTIDENAYEIRKFTHNATFGNLNESRHWDLLSSPSPMEDTGNNGPEGIVFIPDAALTAAGFISSQTGTLYTSTKGMGGLMFVAHQNEGYIWVFDINPTVTNDFAYVGKYKTNREESTDLAFDRSTGLLYILHNIDTNYFEVTDLSTTIVGGERKFVTQSEYFLANPGDGNINIEGFALMPKCPAGSATGAWLARDVESNEDDGILQDCLRWFSPFAADGNCQPLALDEIGQDSFTVFPNPGRDNITVTSANEMDGIRAINSIGQVVFRKNTVGNSTLLDVSDLAEGIYIIEVTQGNNISFTKWIKQR